ncbi:sodium ABC transporter permease [Firmicutes bacterium CAG:822]|nr:sodium ABC transporter permease [Firmicutes bacterium CAG:822]
MINKLKYLTKISLKRKINTKWFVIANIIFAVIIIGLLNMDAIISFFGGDFDQAQLIYVQDNTDRTYDILTSQNDAYKNLIDDSENAFKLEKTTKSSEEIFKDEENKDAWYLTIDNDNENYIKVTLTSEGYINTSSYAGISTIINNTKTVIAMEESNISPEELAKISSPVNLERKILDEDKKSEDENVQMIMSTVFPILILPFFALTMFLVQMVGAEINDEKTTRGMEIIISNVPPKIHLFSKVIASNLFVFLEAALLVIYAIIGFVIRTLIGGSVSTGDFDISSILDTILKSDIASSLAYIIPLTIILMILTFITYAILAGILASMTTNTEDFQQMQMPIVIISLVGYYLAMMAGLFDGSIFIKVLSFIPFISAILAPSLLILGQIGIFEVVIAIILLIITIWLLLKYGMRIYKVGILNYSSKDLWKKMFKALKG